MKKIRIFSQASFILFILIMLNVDTEIIKSISTRTADYPLFAVFTNISKMYFAAPGYKDLIKDKTIQEVQNVPDIILMIGESARSANFSVYGYPYDTNKYSKDIQNLSYIPYAQSSRLSTAWSIACLLTGRDDNEFFYIPNQSTLIAYAYHSGYDVFFVSTTATDIIDSFPNEVGFIKKIYLYDNVLHGRFVKSADEEILNGLNEIYSSYQSGKPKFIILHILGSHFPYVEKVDKKFYEPFKNNISGISVDYKNSKAPLCFNMANNTFDEHQNWYDATILATDYLISETINRLTDKNSLFFYVSDHGESFGENSLPCLHCYGTSNVWAIPFAVWRSDKFISNYPQLNTVLQRNIDTITTAQNKWPSHACILPSILDAMGSKYDFNEELSLFSDNFNATRYPAASEKFKHDPNYTDYDGDKNEK